MNDAALKLARGEDVSGGDPIRPTGTLTMSGGLIVATNGCVSVGERGTGVLTMTGGELWAWGRLSIARLAGSTGTMTVSGGAKVTAYSFYLPYPSDNAITVGDGATLDLGGNAATAASITGTGTLANGTLSLSGTADIRR